jgi:hypothetical protein
MRAPAMSRRAATASIALSLLAACSGGDLPDQKKGGSEVPESLRDAKLAQAAEPIPGVTPMAERVAVLGLLNKRNGLTQDVELKPGEARRIDRVVIQLRACETTPPWESPSETGAFVRLFVAAPDNQMKRVFSGWLFQKRPERNVIEHPIYDVYVKSCTMTFPGVAAEPSSDSAKPAAKASSAANDAGANGGDGGSEAPAGTESTPATAQ